MLMKRKPFLLAPAGKDYLWGGNRLKTDFAKALPLAPLAETWECSTHPDGPCYAVGGQFDALSLGNILKAHPEFRAEPLALPDLFPKNETGMLTLTPGQYDTDGFFICRLRRKP